MEKLPVPNVNTVTTRKLAELSEECQIKSTSAFGLGASLSRRIPDLCPPERVAKLSTKLQEWWMLENFAAFRAEVKKAFKADIPLKERSDWEDMFTAGKAEIEKLSAEIKRGEDEINAIVYKLFDLDADEIKLLEESIGVR